MKFYVISDTHIGLTWDGVDRSDDVFRVFGSMIDKIISCGADYVFHTGDFFHTSSPLLDTVVCKAIDYLRKLDDAGINVRIISGNHDVSYRKDRLSAIEVFNHCGFKNVVAYTFPSYEDYMSYRFVYCPYVPSCKMKREDLGEFILKSVDNNRENFLFSHFDVDGAVIGVEGKILHGGRLPIDVNWLVDYKMCFNGHIHNPQYVSDKLIIVGSPERISADEQESKSFLEVTV